MISHPLFSLSLLLSLLSPTLCASDDPPDPCTIISPRTGAYYDLSPMAMLPEDTPAQEARHHNLGNSSWHARGYDYGANFTVNFCAPVVEELEGVVGMERSLWANVSAYYERDGEVYSIGSVSTSPVFRGRKLVMNITDGSPCGREEGDKWLGLEKRSYRQRTAWKGDGEDGDGDGDGEKDGEDGGEDGDEDGDGGKDGDDDEDEPPRKHHDTERRKSTVFSFLCDQEAFDPARPKVGISFVGWSPDECAYSFEVRSHLACGGLAKASDSVGPGGVFSIIAIITVAVYVFGGIAYQRTVMHQRGWRQLPNYAMWAGIFAFFRDFGIIVFSSCARFIPKRRGYNQLPTHRARGISREEENGLIDSLDEEWND